jgi:hypothetical protein
VTLRYREPHVANDDQSQQADANNAYDFERFLTFDPHRQKGHERYRATSQERGNDDASVSELSFTYANREKHQGITSEKEEVPNNVEEHLDPRLEKR